MSEKDDLINTSVSKSYVSPKYRNAKNPNYNNCLLHTKKKHHILWQNPHPSSEIMYTLWYKKNITELVKRETNPNAENKSNIQLRNCFSKQQNNF